MRTAAIPVLVAVLVGPAAAAAPVPPLAAPAPPPAAPLAWVRFADAKQTYEDVPYVWLGDGDVRVVFEVRPAPGHALDLLWGAKNDTRGARLGVNGREAALSGGGWDGYRWLRAAVPAGVTGERYEVTLRAGPPKPAFLAEVRLVTTAPGEAAPPPDPRATAWKATVQVAPAVPGARAPAEARGEAFPEMRPMWDREPPAAPADPRLEPVFREAEKSARRAAEALYRCRRFAEGWLARADPTSGLIPRNLTRDRDLWNAKDSAADNYPFMVLTCALTDRGLFEGRMREMLRAETRLTSRVGRLPDDFLFSRQGFASERPNLEAVIFGSAEYVKDGLLPLTEWLGASPWSERMIGLIDDVWEHAVVETPFGLIPTRNIEVLGDLLQTCSRLYWFTGEAKYLDWAVRLGDYFLLGDQHPTRHLPTLRLVDHGCEVVNGLSELYAAVAHARPDKKTAYQKPIHEMFDRILEVGRNPHGQLYASLNPRTGEHSDAICDTWGYDYDGVYTVYLIDGTAAYREAVRHVLANLKAHYTGHNWGGADGYADSLEGAINLLNREFIPDAADWIDAEIRAMWAIQKPDGIIEGWHGDGNFARTSILYALWRTQGATVQPWRPDVRLGAARDGDAVCLSLSADAPWRGRVLFDRPRHRLHMRLPLDYPRINQFPEWFTVEAGRRYTLRDLAAGTETTLEGRALAEGVAVDLKPGVEVRWRIAPAP